MQMDPSEASQEWAPSPDGVKRAVSARLGKYQDRNHQDAHEFLMDCVDVLLEENVGLGAQNCIHHPVGRMDLGRGFRALIQPCGMTLYRSVQGVAQCGGINFWRTNQANLLL